MAAKKQPQGNKGTWDWIDHEHMVLLHHEIAGGESADALAIIRAGVLANDIHVDKVAVSLENAPGAGKTVTVTVGNGTSTITVTVSDAETSGSSTTGNFDLDVSAEDLTAALSSTAGTSPGCATIVIIYHDIENV
ncbi:MAG: hypothetical protein KAV82_10395 [Phycisphaerae bacterium]|nr:hypothetical protein [Phycisphaerae bacterium]